MTARPACGHIVMTATVEPSVETPVAVADPAVRLTEYRNAIRVVADSIAGRGWNLVVVETGSYPAAELGGGPSVSAIDYSPAAEELGRGKGAVEFAAVDFALKSVGAADIDTAFKLTGRLSVFNLDRLIRPLGREVMARATINRQWVDTRLIGAPVDIWATVMVGAGTDSNDSKGIFIEATTAGRLAAATAVGNLTLVRFPFPPRFVGRSGTTGNTYGGKARRATSTLRRLIESKAFEAAARKQA